MTETVFKSDLAPLRWEALTDRQQENLLILKRLGARAAENAARIHQHRLLNVMVLGRLRDMGLVESRTVQKNRSQWTEYWLTRAAFKYPPMGGKS